jgi:PleD family two-component response regulator
VLSKQTKGNDLAARLGGEKFVVLLPDTDINGAVAVVELIRLCAANYKSGQGRWMAINVSKNLAVS